MQYTNTRPGGCLTSKRPLRKLRTDGYRRQHLLGATAIQETIEDLPKAEIKIWVATGDKLEPATSFDSPNERTNVMN